MIKKVSNVISNRLFFICVLVITLLFDTNLVIHNYTGPLIKVFLVWGAFIIIKDLLQERSLWKTKHLKWLLLFCVLYMITTIINAKEYWVPNIKVLAYMLLFFIVLYGHDVKKSMDAWKKEVNVIILTFVWTTAILSFICLLTFVYQINVEILTVDGYTHLGLYDNRLWGLYNPNIGGCINLVAILFSLGLCVSGEKKKIYTYVLLALNIILQYVCLVLTASRTSLYTLIICGAGFLFLVFDAKVEVLSIKKIKGFVLNVLIVAVLAMGCYGLSEPTKDLMAYVPGIAAGRFPEKLELTRLEILENRDGGVLTGRLYLWGAGIKAWERSPIFGISETTIYDYAKPYVHSEKWLISLESSLHNGYITVLVASGIVGAVVVFMFLVLNGLPMLKGAFQYSKEKNYIWYVLLIAVTGSFLIADCLEARLFYRTEIFTAMFWIVLGYAYNYIEICENKKITEVPNSEREMNG